MENASSSKMEENDVDLNPKEQKDDFEAMLAAEPEAQLQTSEKIEQILRVVGTPSHHGVSPQRPPDSPSKRSRKDRMAEKKEDEVMLADEMEDLDLDVPHVYHTHPHFVKGGEMRVYQIEALNWLIALYDNNSNGILADEMGLGKTLESISMLGYLKTYRRSNGPHLVIVPKSTSSNWIREVKKWCPSLTVFKFHGSKAQREVQRKQLGQTDVVVTTYEIALREVAALKRLDWDYLFIDEAHRIKNEKSMLSKAVRLFKSKHRLLITGTPLQNNLRELWALLNFLLPAKFPSADSFQDAFDALNAEDQSNIADKLHKMLRKYLLRRLKADVEKDLPPKIETKLYVGLTAMQSTWYQKLLSKDIDIINSTTGKKMRMLNVLMQLRKVCNHPYLFQGAEPGPPFIEGEHLIANSGKMILLDKLLKRLKEKGNRVLLFSQMTRLLDILEDYCLWRQFEYCRIDGSTKQEVRDDAMDAFNEKDSDKFIFLLSTRAGGLGINLQTADTVILYDSDWNPQMDLQAQDRAHRIGQKKQVNVYRFVTEGTCEEKIVQRATEKLFLDALVIQQGRLKDKDKNMSARDVQAMVRFGAQKIFEAKGGTITDEDIEAILSRGKEKTSAENAKLKTDCEFSLANFTSTSDSQDMYDFQGIHYREVNKTKSFEFLELPSRQAAKANYDVNKYYRELAGDNVKPPKVREFRPASRPDWQFFNNARLEELERRQWNANNKFRQLLAAYKTQRKAEQKLQRSKQRLKTSRSSSVPSPGGNSQNQAPLPSSSVMDMDVDVDAPEGNGDDGDSDMKDADAQVPERDGKETSVSGGVGAAGNANNKENRNGKRGRGRGHDAAAGTTKRVKTEQNRVAAARATKIGNETKGAEHEKDEVDPTSQEEAIAAIRSQCDFLTEKEEKEKAELLQDGFGSWSRRHFTSFLKACERFGRKDVKNIVLNVEDKTPEEVQQFHTVFWKRHRQLADCAKYLAQVVRGEERLQRYTQISKLVKSKYSRLRDPKDNMEIPYPPSSKRNTYSEEEDRFLVCMLHEVGWGNWAEIKLKIQDDYRFRFDWFIKSRSPEELKRRCDYLVKLLEKEQEARQKRAPSKGKRAQSKGKGSKGNKGQSKGQGKGKSRGKSKGKSGGKRKESGKRASKGSSAPRRKGSKGSK